MTDRTKSTKIMVLYLVIVIGFIIFLSVMFFVVVEPRKLPTMYAQESSKAQRGDIISADGFHIATTKKLYKAIVNTKYIDPQKKELFIELFCIYSGEDANEIRKRLNKRRGSVVLSYNISQINAQYLRSLCYELKRFKVFVPIGDSSTMIQGLDIKESGESRMYPYGNLLTPIIGYPRKIEDDGYTKIMGVKGLEKRFEEELKAKQDAFSRGQRDINSYKILNKNSFTKPAINGLDIKLTIPIAFQIKIERMLDGMKKEIRAKEIMIAIMNSTTGEVLSLASSNRYLPKDIKRSEYPYLNSGMIEYSFEPGSVIKVITFALLLDRGLVNPFELVNAHHGRYKIGKTIITDEHKFNWLSAENVIVHSSNIGIAQLANKLTGIEFNIGLKDFGFAQKSTPDLIYEKVGKVPSARRLENEIYKSRCSYGYGMRANLMQLIKAYSVFSNNGRMVTPKLVSSFIDEYKREISLENEEQVQVIKSATAVRMRKILIKTVNEGTGTKAKTQGLAIGGKTGTAHIVENHKYVRKYNTSFIGFADDRKSKYTIGVVVIQPKKSQFAAQTAVPVFKKAVDIMVEEGYYNISNK
jgi:cell division protein FtsI (penicillin-binding protein 3)